MLLICIPRVEQNTPDSVFSTVEAVRVSLKAENGEEEELAGGLACPRISGTGRWAGGLAPCGVPAACPGPAGLGGRAGGAPCRRPPRPARGEAAVGQAAGAVPPRGKPTRRGVAGRVRPRYCAGGGAQPANLACHKPETRVLFWKTEENCRFPQISSHL